MLCSSCAAPKPPSAKGFNLVLLTLDTVRADHLGCYGGHVEKFAGISQLSISPVLGNESNGNNAGANITIRQRVTGNLFITFSTNTASTQNEVIQGQYQVSPRVSLSATRDQNGGFAVDTLIKKTW